MFEALRASEAKLRSVVSATPIVLWEVDKNGTILFSEGQALQSLGLAGGQLVGQSVYEIYRANPDALTSIRNALHGQASNSEVLVGGVWWSNQYTAVFDSQGRVERVIGISMDITERKLAQKTLQESEARFRSYVDNAPDAIFLVGPEGRYLDVNPVGMQMTGYGRDELLTMALPDLVPEQYRPAVMRGLTELYERGRVTQEIPLQRKSGSVFWSLIDSVIIGRERFLSFAKDITARKKVEEALRESERKFARVVEECPVAMALVCTDGTIEYINKKAIEVFGYEAQDIPTMERWWLQAYPDEPHRTKTIQQWMSLVSESLTHNRPIEKRIYRVTCKNGKVIPVFIYGVWVGNKVLAMFEEQSLA